MVWKCECRLEQREPVQLSDSERELHVCTYRPWGSRPDEQPAFRARAIHIQLRRKLGAVEVLVRRRPQEAGALVVAEAQRAARL